MGQGGADVSQLQDCGSVVACVGGGDELLARAGAGAGQDRGQNIYHTRTLGDEALYYPIMKVHSQTF